jgi:hypothetical protein
LLICAVRARPRWVLCSSCPPGSGGGTIYTHSDGLPKCFDGKLVGGCKKEAGSDRESLPWKKRQQADYYVLTCDYGTF